MPAWRYTERSTYRPAEGFGARNDEITRTMSYIDKTTGPGEQVLLRARLHPALWMLPIDQTLLMAIVILLAGGGTILIGGTEYAEFGLIPLAIIVVAAGNALIWILLIPNHIAAYLGMDFVVTNKRIVRRYGLMRAELMELPLNKVESLTAGRKGIWGRLLGYGEINVHGMGGTRFGITHAADPLGFRRKALEILEEGSAEAA